ncbi:MAG: hypothetical protein ACOYL5_13360 [Phototrophicaceae bacterium]|jgi:hypothetical protein
MSETFDKLKALLQEKKTVTPDDINKMETDHGKMTDAERVELEAQKLELEKAGKPGGITLEEYQAALKVLDTAEEGSDEYKKAEALADKYESGT